ncbi:unnamed protein product [Prorocentrum cordatum]|uniref:Subtilisin n=1 Tax=Prorocentrum cordatum TaxID=2364126 RepID=A0ABN9WXT3_9DINO|nr:unnamed protein product [Polarella glacialis]
MPPSGQCLRMLIVPSLLRISTPSLDAANKACADVCARSIQDYDDGANINPGAVSRVSAPCGAPAGRAFVSSWFGLGPPVPAGGPERGTLCNAFSSSTAAKRRRCAAVVY